ncbi:MAG: succinate dehydrogenase hydrophobic membrane anchor subunit [Actinomycetales bacterium]|nr:succinate dehydrogenase hydrophobic membrane anchor subunit [Actinomycetales bacterium]
MSDTATTTVEPPRYSRAPRKARGLEKRAWLYMRASGILLVVLIFGHLLINMFLGTGVRAIDFAFVAGKLANPFWIVWDSLILWLALIHGANGMRTIVNDYARGALRAVLLGALLVATVVLLVLGSLVLWTFDPCIGDTSSGVLAELCGAQ